MVRLSGYVLTEEWFYSEMHESMEKQAIEQSSKQQLPHSLWILFAGTFINRFGSFVSIFLVLYMLSRGYSAPQAGAAASAYGIGSVIASPLGGYLADWLGRRNTIMLSMFSSAVTMLLLSQATDLLFLMLLVVLAGLTTELYRPASSALVADLVASQQRVRAFALYEFAINLGVIVGPAVGGFFASRSFLFLFVGDALTSFVFGLLALFALPTEGQKRIGEQQKQSASSQTQLLNRRFFLFLLATMAVAFVYLQYLAAFSLQIRELGLSDNVYGLLISLNGLAIVILQLPLSVLIQRFPRKVMLAAGFLLTGLGFSLIAFVSSVPLLALAVIIWTLGEMIYSPVSLAYVADLVPSHLRGRSQGMWEMVWGIGFIIAPLLGTLLFSWNAQALWLLCGFLGVISAVLVLW